MQPVARKHIPANILFDTRMAEQNLRNGIITLEEYEEHLKSIPDSLSKAVEMEFQPNSPEEEKTEEDVSDETNEEISDEVDSE